MPVAPTLASHSGHRCGRLRGSRGLTERNVLSSKRSFHQRFPDCGARLAARVTHPPAQPGAFKM